MARDPGGPVAAADPGQDQASWSWPFTASAVMARRACLKLA
jgi:hypothetical protein